MADTGTGKTSEELEEERLLEGDEAEETFEWVDSADVEMSMIGIEEAVEPPATVPEGVEEGKSDETVGSQATTLEEGEEGKSDETVESQAMTLEEVEEGEIVDDMAVSETTTLVEGEEGKVADDTVENFVRVKRNPPERELRRSQSIEVISEEEDDVVFLAATSRRRDGAIHPKPSIVERKVTRDVAVQTETTQVVSQATQATPSISSKSAQTAGEVHFDQAVQCTLLPMEGSPQEALDITDAQTERFSPCPSIHSEVAPVVPVRREEERPARFIPYPRWGNPEEVREVVVEGQAVLIRPRLPGCYNCGVAGHHYRNCRRPRRCFCYRCGLRGVTIRNCPACAERWREEGPYVPALGCHIPREQLEREGDIMARARAEY